MTKRTKDNFLPITALPMLEYAITGALDAAKDQLLNLEKAKNKPHVLDDELVTQVINSYTKQNASIADERALCKHWLQTQLTIKQKNIIDGLLVTLDRLETVNQQIIFLAEHYKDHTIDKILNMDELELTLTYFQGQLYEPGIDEDIVSSGYKKTEPSFQLPPQVFCKEEPIKNNGTSYIFRHQEWGELGRIEVIPHGAQSQVNAFAVISDVDDPLGEMRNVMFRHILVEFNAVLETKYIQGTAAASESSPSVSCPGGNNRVVESKLMVCKACNTPVALLVFAPDAHTESELEDYVRMMHRNIRATNLPTWIIGAETEVVPDKEGIAMILKIWPKREAAKKISSLVFDPMLDKLQSTHCIK